MANEDILAPTRETDPETLCLYCRLPMTYIVDDALVANYGMREIVLCENDSCDERGDWNLTVIDYEWVLAFNAFREFAKQHGHTNPPLKGEEGVVSVIDVSGISRAIRVGHWVESQRATFNPSGGTEDITREPPR